MKTIFAIILLSTLALAQEKIDSTDIKRIDTKIKNLEMQYKQATEEIKKYEDIKRTIEGAFQILIDERKIADEKLKNKITKKGESK